MLLQVLARLFRAGRVTSIHFESEFGNALF